jgi:DNA-binding NtrC family response regulator
MNAFRGATVVVKGSGGLSLERPVFELIEAGGRKHRFDATKVRIGAGPGNDLILDRPTVSSVHAELEATPRGLRLRDLGSTNGTLVGDLRVFDVLLTDGATVTVGDVMLTLRMSKDVVTLPLSDKTELHGAVGASPSMRALFSRLERVAKTDATVLLQGETGTGKEVLAWSLYEASRRKDQPFVVVDCGSIARTLVESELFGHEKGAFTGADKRRIGAFERAQGGTLFLDELGELELDLQPKLLRALERREIQRVGGDKPIAVDVRIVAATHRDLRAMVARGEFREDLYYRLAVVSLDIPPLRERREDIPVLVAHFLRGLGVDESALAPGTLERFQEHDWPGNARELKNAVERVVVLGETRLGDPRTTTSSPSPSVGTSGTSSAGTNPAAHSGTTTPPTATTGGSFAIDPVRPYKDQKADVIADFEERYVRLLMKTHNGNVSAAARVAGIDRMSLHKILDRYGLDARHLARQG